MWRQRSTRREEFPAVHPQVLRTEGHLQGDVGGEELGLEILEHEADAVGQIAGPLLPYVLARDAHPARELASDEMGNGTVQRAGQRGSAGAASAEQADQLARTDVDAEVGEGGLPPSTIAEGDILEPDHARKCSGMAGGATRPANPPVS